MTYPNEKPECEYFFEMGMSGCNVCYPNTPHSCDRSQREGECLEGKPRLILHFVIYKSDRPRYLCNQACGTTPKKMAHQIKAITCKNCKKAIKKLDREWRKDPEAFKEKYQKLFTSPKLLTTLKLEKMNIGD